MRDGQKKDVVGVAGWRGGVLKFEGPASRNQGLARPSPLLRTVREQPVRLRWPKERVPRGPLPGQKLSVCLLDQDGVTPDNHRTADPYQAHQLR